MCCGFRDVRGCRPLQAMLRCFGEVFSNRVVAKPRAQQHHSSVKLGSVSFRCCECGCARPANAKSRLCVVSVTAPGISDLVGSICTLASDRDIHRTTSCVSNVRLRPCLHGAQSHKHAVFLSPWLMLELASSASSRRAQSFENFWFAGFTSVEPCVVRPALALSGWGALPDS